MEPVKSLPELAKVLGWTVHFQDDGVRLQAPAPNLTFYPCRPTEPEAWADLPAEVRAELHCHAGRDGDCFWKFCPQTRDNEPVASGRHCPLDTPDPDY